MTNVKTWRKKTHKDVSKEKCQEDIKEIPKAENISEESDEYEEISKDKKEDTIDSMYGEKDE